MDSVPKYEKRLSNALYIASNVIPPHTHKTTILEEFFMRFLRLVLSITIAGMFHIVSAQSITSASADEIGRDWKRNALGADLKYGKKTLNITGVVVTVDSIFDRYYVALKAEGLFTGIRVYLDPSAPVEEIANLSAGQRVTMYCANIKDSLGLECYDGRLVK